MQKLAQGAWAGAWGSACLTMCQVPPMSPEAPRAVPPTHLLPLPAKHPPASYFLSLHLGFFTQISSGFSPHSLQVSAQCHLKEASPGHPT